VGELASPPPSLLLLLDSRAVAAMAAKRQAKVKRASSKRQAKVKRASSKRPAKGKRVSKIARGHHAKLFVFRGRNAKTSGGLTKKHLMKNKRGKVVAVSRSGGGRLALKNLGPWNLAVASARRELALEAARA
jgi:hypothetical protein